MVKSRMLPKNTWTHQQESDYKTVSSVCENNFTKRKMTNVHCDDKYSLKKDQH